MATKAYNTGLVAILKKKFNGLKSSFCIHFPNTKLMEVSFLEGDWYMEVSKDQERMENRG